MYSIPSSDILNFMYIHILSVYEHRFVRIAFHVVPFFNPMSKAVMVKVCHGGIYFVCYFCSRQF